MSAMDESQMPPPVPALAKENRLHRILAVQTIVVVLAVLCVGLRLYVRVKMTKRRRLDHAGRCGKPEISMLRNAFRTC